VKKSFFQMQERYCPTLQKMILFYFLLALFFSGCVMGQSTARPGHSKDLFQIKNLIINDLPGVTEVVIQGEGPLFYKAFKVPDSHQLILEVPGVTLENHIKPITVNRGAVVDVYPRETQNPNKGVQFEINLLPSAKTRVRGEEGKIIVEISDSSFAVTKRASNLGQEDKKFVSLETTTENDFPLKDSILEKEKVFSFSKDYLIGPEDRLEVLVWKNEVLSRTVTVRPDGKISFPLIGDLNAAGITPLQLRDKIVFQLREFLENPTVTVIVKQINSYVVYLLGEVVNQGKYQLRSNTTLLQALTLAGGFTSFASKNKIMVIRREYGRTSDTKIRIRYDDIVSGSHNENILLKPGDTILVP